LPACDSILEPSEKPLRTDPPQVHPHPPSSHRGRRAECSNAATGPSNAGVPVPSRRSGFTGILHAIDEKLAKGLVCHEVLEAYLHSFDPRESSFPEQHASAIGFENAVLKQLGSDLHRGDERTESDPDDDSMMHIIDYGKFELDMSVSADATESGDIYRKDH
jgi:hypothetical protein